jgi:DNA-binding MarR family transcriptional regulator
MNGEQKDEFDKAFDNVLRLRIMSILMVNEQFDFSSFKTLLQVTDGNLASHLRNLENATYVQIEKSFVGRKPITQYSATEKGKEAFLSHLKFLEALIQSNKF